MSRYRTGWFRTGPARRSLGRSKEGRSRCTSERARRGRAKERRRRRTTWWGERKRRREGGGRSWPPLYEHELDGEGRPDQAQREPGSTRDLPNQDPAISEPCRPTTGTAFPAFFKFLTTLHGHLTYRSSPRSHRKTGRCSTPNDCKNTGRREASDGETASFSPHPVHAGPFITATGSTYAGSRALAVRISH